MKLTVSLFFAVLSAFVANSAEETITQTAAVRFVWADGAAVQRTETRQIELAATGDDAWRLVLPKSEIPLDVSRVEVVPGFMCAKKGDDGYWIDGRGVYGEFGREKGVYRKDRQVMPVFGVKRGDSMWCARVKKWRFDYDFMVAATNGEYQVYPSFRCGEVRRFFTEYYNDIEIEFNRLSGDKANYNGLAEIYRRHQLDSGAVRTIKERMRDYPELAYLCEAIVVRLQTHASKPIPDEDAAKLFFKRGEELPVVVRMPFGAAEEFMTALKNAGVDKLSICSAGWQDGGYDGRVPGHFPVCAEAGGEEEFLRLVAKAKELGYQFALHASNTDGYMCSKLWSEDWVCKRADGSLDKGGIWSGGQCYWVCQKYAWEHWLPDEMRRMADLGIRGPHYIDVYSATYPQRCGDRRHWCPPEEMAEYQNKILAEGKRLMGGSASESGFDHVAGNLDYINYIERDLQTLAAGRASPLVSGVAPLWELVYHGIILYTPDRWCQNHTRGKCMYKLEKSGDPRWMIGDGIENPRVALKIVEFGGRPIFYTYRFEDVPRIRKAWEEFVPVRHLQKERMTKHERIDDNVFMTSFEDGSRIISNYRDEIYDYRENAIKPVSYILINPDGTVFTPKAF